jgi:chitodextrinase
VVESKSASQSKVILCMLIAAVLSVGCGSSSDSGATPTPIPGPSPDTQAPTVPTGLASSNVTSSNATISWTASTDNVGVTGYKIYRGGTQVGTSTSTSFTDSNLSASTAYSYTIAAYDAAGNTSAQSAAQTVTTSALTTDTQPPSVPSNLVASNITSSGATISWTASTDNVGVTGYKIYRGGTQVGTSASTSFSDLNLAPSTAYAYTVAAFDAAGNTSAQSAAKSVTTQASLTTVIQSFDGASGPGYKDHPDVAGAVGPNHVVDFVGSTFTVHDKTTGSVVVQLSQTQFWTNAGVTPGTLNDPRLVYDPLVGRWYAVTAGPNPYLAVSAGNDPTGAWKAVTLDTSISGDLSVHVGFDLNGVYLACFGGNNNSNAYAIPKADVLWAGASAPSLAHLGRFPNVALDLFPVVDLDASKAATAPQVYLTRQGGQNATNLPIVLVMYKLTWSGLVATLSAAQNISTSMSYTTPTSAVQPGSAPAIRGIEDHRLCTVFASGGSVFTCQGNEVNGRIGFFWFEVRVSDGAIIQQAQFADPSYDVLFPSVAVDANGNLGIGFTKTSATEFPSVYVTGRLATDTINTLRTPVLATAGTTGYSCPPTSPVGWGTYSVTVQDPSNPLTLWTYQEYAHSATACQWATRWVAFSL